MGTNNYNLYAVIILAAVNTLIVIWFIIQVFFHFKNRNKTNTHSNSKRDIQNLLEPTKH